MTVTPNGDTKTYENGDGRGKEAIGVVVMGQTESGGGGSSGQTVSAAGVTPVDRSGTITTGGTAQQLMAANTDRKGFWIQNVSDGDLWISDIGTAVADQPSMLLPSGALYEAPMTGVPSGAISIIGATTGQSFSAREW